MSAWEAGMRPVVTAARRSVAHVASTAAFQPRADTDMFFDDVKTLYDLVDRLASWKINQLQLYTEHTFAYRNHPEARP